MSIQLTIEQLVLDGLSLSTLQGIALKLSVETELTQLLREHRLEGMTEESVPRLNVDSIQLASGGRPHEWGRQIARNLYAGLVGRSADAKPAANRSPEISLRGDATATRASLPQNIMSTTVTQ